jgi:hypothetical protein
VLGSACPARFWTSSGGTPQIQDGSEPRRVLERVLSPLIGAELEFVPEEQPSLHDDVIVGRARERLRFISVPERFLYEASRNNPSCMLECPALPEARLRFCEGETRMAELLDHARETAILIDGAVLATNRK